MELQYQTLALCHPSDIWEVFKPIENWHQLTPAFGQAGWVQGEPWKPGSRFFLELNAPQRMDLEVVVQKCRAPREVAILSHGGGIAIEQWLQFSVETPSKTLIRMQAVLVGVPLSVEDKIRSSLLDFYANWFDGLKAAAEKHCSLVAL